ncbi:MAG: O-acetyl-ADP-ribose deacetylase [Chloroflexota bacterium]|jgi:O-acetyl-ADP-ribose deacetylase (regulator of RNase III)|nr:O-acetyl-ADP-ribose deacetylase [Chloroflexota bacterium]
MTARLTVVKGDITEQQVDVIVNAANSSLRGGSGVDGAIHRAAGPGLDEECRTIGGCPTGEARITRGYRLPAPWIIHTVGPIWCGRERGESELLAQCYRNCLALVEERGLCTVAFPSISTGAYAFPVDQASAIAVREIRAFLDRNETVEQVRVVCFDDGTFRAYLRQLAEDTI